MYLINIRVNHVARLILITQFTQTHLRSLKLMHVFNDLNELIKEMYECELFEKEFEEVERMFFECFKVFTSESEIIEE